MCAPKVSLIRHEQGSVSQGTLVHALLATHVVAERRTPRAMYNLQRCRFLVTFVYFVQLVYPPLCGGLDVPQAGGQASTSKIPH